MFGKNLTYYRLKAGMTKKELAEKAGVSQMAITHYEKEERNPDMKILKSLASVLGVRVSDFLSTRNEHVKFAHGEFRKNTTLTKSQQEYVAASVEQYFGRFMTIVEILGEKVLPAPPACHQLELQEDAEKSAQLLRKYLEFAPEGPIEDLTGKLENKGILIYLLEIDNSKFSGRNGFVNGRPYIVLNKTMSAERNRSTLVHELAHLMFRWPEDQDEKEAERQATAISGAFLFPKEDAIRELGLRRKFISPDMIHVAQEYGISMMLLAMRAKICKIVSEEQVKSFYMTVSQMGWKKNEPSRIPMEEPALFRQLVYRAVSEEEISLQRGAELLGISYAEIEKECCFDKG